MSRSTPRPTVYPALRYRDARAAMAFLTDAFGFTEVAVYDTPEGAVAHAELRYGNGLVMLGTTDPQTAKEMGPSSVYVVVEDPDRHQEHAAARGAHIVRAVSDKEQGARREYTARDPEGNLWSFGTYQPSFPGD
ncbi:bleomycin resistance protein [Wenjunlia vitaminophila]|uniref:Bleomycin resistance protein n=1 Tax=Wenjunlia vitaminophila TaxID=76728 RepID=A0A0T6LT51_WENVI|nr:VOC family protein [Wenjunlia vitaminophila]KRV49293.1 bleomycin resistance protein [Wenjunlia vitaminophila]